MQLHIIGQLWQEGIVSLALAVAGGLLMVPIRLLKKSYLELLEAVNSTKAELCIQRENHLTHIESASQAQVKLLEKTVETLEAMHLDQRLLLGRLDK